MKNEGFRPQKYGLEPLKLKETWVPMVGCGFFGDWTITGYHSLKINDWSDTRIHPAGTPETESLVKRPV